MKKTKTYYVGLDKNLNQDFGSVSDNFENIKFYERILEIEVPILTEEIDIKSDLVQEIKD